MDPILSSLESVPPCTISKDSRRRLKKRIQGELAFLDRATLAGKDPSASSNVNHLQALVTLLGVPAVRGVIGVLQTVRVTSLLLASKTKTRLSQSTSNIAVDLVCLFRGKPAWVIASARNPNFLFWDAPTNKEVTPYATHDTPLRQRVARVLEAASCSSELLRPSRIVFYFARGLSSNLVERFKVDFSATICHDLEPLGFEIQVRSAQPKTVEGSDLIQTCGEMAPESDALAWSLMDDALASSESKLDEVGTSSPHLVGGWVVVTELKAPESGSSQKQAGTDEIPHEAVVEEAGKGAISRVTEVVKRLENKGEPQTSATKSKLSGAESLSCKNKSNPAPDSVVALSPRDSSLSQSETDDILVLESGWVDVPQVEYPCDAQSFPSENEALSTLASSESPSEDKGWVALSPTAHEKQVCTKGSALQTSAGEKAVKPSAAVAGDWIGVGKAFSGDKKDVQSSTFDNVSEEICVEDSEGLTANEAKQRPGQESGNGRDRIKAYQGSPKSGQSLGSELRSGLKEKAADQSPENRFRTLNKVAFAKKPSSWPSEMELVNLDTTALVAFVSGVTNGDAQALREMPEKEFNKRWKGNANFMRDQIEAELQYPQLPYLESVLSGKAILVTQYVLKEFVSIVSTVGGEEERKRAEALLQMCWLIADGPSERLRGLPTSRAIKPRHVSIFGTADAWGCPTLTSNAAFARAVQKVGVPLWILEPRPSALVGS